MTDKPTPHQTFLERLKALSPADSEEDILEKTGFDLIEADESVSSTERHVRLFEPTTGDSVASVTFQASLTRPSSFPTDWPFIPEVDCTLTRTIAQARPIAVMHWVVEDDESLVRERINQGMLDLGWHDHAPTAARAGVDDLLAWYQLGQEWRVLARRRVEDVVALVLSESRPDLLPS